MEGNPLKTLSNIAKRLRKTAHDVAGLDLKAFQVTPNVDSEDGPHYAQAVFVLDENFVPLDPKDDEWEAFQIDQARHAEEERQKEAKAGLGDLMRKLDGGREEGIL